MSAKRNLSFIIGGPAASPGDDGNGWEKTLVAAEAGAVFSDCQIDFIPNCNLKIIMEVEVKFEPSGRYGVVPAGTYVIDAAARFGIRIDDDCGRRGECDSCAVRITKGASLLSEPTQAELEHLSTERRSKGERLSCQAKIEKSGEICVMTTEKAKPEATTFESFQKEFGDLPLDEKVKYLLQLETVTLSETFSYILNLPFTIGEKLRDGIAEFGFKMEEEERKAKRPTEHKAEETPAAEPEPEAPKAEKTTTKAKSSVPKKPPVRKKTGPEDQPKA
jgi:ferredoxin